MMMMMQMMTNVTRGGDIARGTGTEGWTRGGGGGKGMTEMNGEIGMERGGVGTVSETEIGEIGMESEIDGSEIEKIDEIDLTVSEIEIREMSGEIEVIMIEDGGESIEKEKMCASSF
jgi:hypothetical protein